MTYAINDRQSFNNIENWMKQIQENAAENASVMLVANKVQFKDQSDMTERVVDVTEGRALAKKFDIPFLEVSAKQGDNIESIFETIAKEIKKKNLDQD